MNPTILECDLEHLNNVCEVINSIIDSKRHIILLLQGDIGAGKTSLVSAYVDFMGIDDSVTSPTFSIMHQYGDNIFHYDLYNRSLSDLLSLGLLDLLENKGIHFVEWGDMRLFEILRPAFGDICIVSIDRLADKRIYRINNIN